VDSQWGEYGYSKERECHLEPSEVSWQLGRDKTCTERAPYIKGWGNQAGTAVRKAVRKTGWAECFIDDSLRGKLGLTYAGLAPAKHQWTEWVCCQIL